MEELEIFKNKQFVEIRAFITKETPWFVASDVCKALDLSNATVSVQRLDEDEKSKFNLGLSGGETNVVNEYGLYSLVLSSRKPEAKAFKRWITHDVIPSIRKHGAYATPDTIDRIIQNPDFGIKLLQELKDARHEIEAKAELIEQLQPKATYYDLVLQCKDAVSTTTIAKDFGMSARKLNALLNGWGVQFCQSGRWFLYSKYEGFGYATSKTSAYTNSSGEIKAKTAMYWTQKGRMFLYELLKAKGFTPEVEKE